MLTTVILGIAGCIVLAGIVIVFARSRQADLTDHVPQSVLTRINAEYRDIR